MENLICCGERGCPTVQGQTEQRNVAFQRVALAVAVSCGAANCSHLRFLLRDRAALCAWAFRHRRHRGPWTQPGRGNVGGRGSGAVCVSCRGPGCDPRRGLLPRGRTLTNTWPRLSEPLGQRQLGLLPDLARPWDHFCRRLGSSPLFFWHGMMSVELPSGDCGFLPCCAEDELPPKIFGRRGGPQRAFCQCQHF